MDIVGGLYLESCEVPHWSATYGSGGRAAAAVVNLSPQTRLHTFANLNNEKNYQHLADLGIVLCLSQAPERIAFSYFHPMSKPHLHRVKEKVELSNVIHVEGSTVLRFGMVEGEARVKAKRAIYDPQVGSAATPFSQNGSTANELAVVLNEDELQLAGGAAELIASGQAAVVVVKRGPFGATVLQKESEVRVPAYWTSNVFKIGSGDVFSAIFAYFWGEVGMRPECAADLASRATASYCETRNLPPELSSHRRAVNVGRASRPRVRIEGSVSTIGRRYLMEEIRFILRGCHVEATASALGDSDNNRDGTRLVVLDGYDGQTEYSDRDAIYLLEKGAQLSDDPPEKGLLTDDLTTAVYWSAWSAIEKSSYHQGNR